MSEEQAAIKADAHRPSAEKQVTDRVVTEELIAGWKTLKPSCYTRVLVGAKTDLGAVRENNEDKFDFLEPARDSELAGKGRLYGVADGMGGHSAGQIASELALKTVIRSYFGDQSTRIDSSLYYAISEANELIYDTAQMIPDRRDMGTTLTLGVIYEDRLIVAHTGDSRAYLLRNGVIEQITQDHSWVAEQVSLGALTLEQAQMSPFRNIITRSIGTQPSVEPDFYSVDLQIGDRLLLCSDGLTAHLDADDIQRLAGSFSALAAGPSVTAMKLVEIANERGGRDNITVLIIDVIDIEPRQAELEITDTREQPLTLLNEDEELTNHSADLGNGQAVYGIVG
jgi:serine/threonine protein phosphatase PrpC